MKNLLYCLMLLSFISCSDDTDTSPEPENKITITSNVGIGDISFQDDGNAVIDVYGNYDMINANVSLNDAFYAIWFDEGVAFQLDAVDVSGLSLQEVVDMADELVDLNQTIQTMIIMSPFEGATTQGIKIGSPRADVITAFGEPDEIGSITEEYFDLNMNVWYNSSNNTVRRIDLMK